MKRSRWLVLAVVSSVVGAEGACTTSSGPVGTSGPSFDSGTTFDVTMEDSSAEETGTDATSAPDQTAMDSGVGEDTGTHVDSSAPDSGAPLDAAMEAEAAPADAGHEAGPPPPWSCPMPVTYPTGSGPQSPVIVNLTHRALPDVAIVNHLDNNLYVYLNAQGDAGVLQSAAVYPSGNGTNMHEVVVADINGDGWADLAATSLSDFTVHLNAADGTGTMVNAGSVDWGEPYAGDGLTFGDVNGDGRPDFVGPEINNTSVAVLLNQTTDGGVSWGPAAYYQAGTLPDSVALGDLTGHHVLDLAVGNLDSQNAGIYVGDGGGGFTLTQTIPIGGPAGGESGAVEPFADLNGDGALDLLLDSAEIGDSGVFGFFVLINKNDGTGTFQPPVPFTIAGGGNVVATYDMNGDGSLDLVGITTDYTHVWVMLNQNDGVPTFVAPTFCPSGTLTYDLAAGDLNGDGKGDIVTANYTNSLGVIMGF